MKDIFLVAFICIIYKHIPPIHPPTHQLIKTGFLVREICGTGGKNHVNVLPIKKLSLKVTNGFKVE